MFKEVFVVVGKKVFDHITDLAIIAISTWAFKKATSSNSGTQYQSRKCEEVFLKLPTKDTVYERKNYKEVFLCLNYVKKEEPRKEEPASENNDTTCKVAEEDLSRVLGIFVERFKAISIYGETVLTYKDIICSLGGELEDLSPKLSPEKRKETAMLGKCLKEFVSDEATAEKTAAQLYSNIIGRAF